MLATCHGDYRGIDDGYAGVHQAAWKRERWVQRQGAVKGHCMSRKDDTLGKTKGTEGRAETCLWAGRQMPDPHEPESQAIEPKL